MPPLPRALRNYNPFAVSILRSSVRGREGEGEGREEKGQASNIRFKLSNWISATEALGSSPKFAKRARNANRDGEDRDWAERIGLFESSLDFQSRLQTCAVIASAACTSPVSLGTLSACKLSVQINIRVYTKYFIDPIIKIT